MIAGWVAAGLMVMGAVCVTVAAFGIGRFPDSLARAHALGLGATMGVLFAMVGVTVAFFDLATGAKAILTVLFVYFTSPVGSHMLGRAAYRFGLLPVGLRVDELAGEDRGSEDT